MRTLSNGALPCLIVLVAATLVIPSAQAQTYSLLYSFQCGSDGSNPYGGLVRDGAGNLYGTTYAGGSGYGVVFKLTPSGALRVLHTFAGSPMDGATPVDTLIRDSAGNLFGTTGEGGVNNYGTVFKVTPTGVESVLHFFEGGTADGASPFGGLTQDPAGNLYGTTVLGGANDAGTIFKVTAAGAETVLYSFGLPPDGAQPHAGLLRDPAGNLYGTARDGGQSIDGTVFKLTPAGREYVLWNFAGSPNDGQYPHSVLIQDAMHNVYGTTLDGGDLNRGSVFELSASGKEMLLHSFANTTMDGGTPENSLLLDAAGNLYGTASVGGAHGCGTVFKYTP